MPMNKNRYPEIWKELSREIRIRADGQCECIGKCGRDHGGRCRQLHGQLSVFTENDGRVVLTVAHLCRDSDHPELEGKKCANVNHLKAMCQACHLAFDLVEHQKNSSVTRDCKRGHSHLFQVQYIEPRSAVAYVDIALWATEAVACLVCQLPWSPEAVIQRSAKVATVVPRRLVCAACWPMYIKRTDGKPRLESML